MSYVSYRLGCGGENVKNIFDTCYKKRLLNQICVLENHSEWNNPYPKLLKECSLSLQKEVSTLMDWNMFFKMIISSTPTTFSFGGWKLGLRGGAAGIGMNLIFKLNI